MSIIHFHLFMQLGNFFIWTHTYGLIRKSISHCGRIHKDDVPTNKNRNPEVVRKTTIFDPQDYSDQEEALLLPSSEDSEPSDRTADHHNVSVILRVYNCTLISKNGILN